MIPITVNGVPYQVPSSAADVDWAAKQVAFEQAIAAAVNDALTPAAPVWIPLVPQLAWLNVGGGLAPAAYYVADNLVHLRFALRAGVNGTQALALPVGARPPYTLEFPTMYAGQLSSVLVEPSGVVTLNGIAYDPTNGSIFEGAFSKVANP